MTTTLRPRQQPAAFNRATIEGQIEALEHQLHDLDREIAIADAKQQAALAAADIAEQALADGTGPAEAVTTNRALAQAFGRKIAELRAKRAPIDQAIAPKREVIARDQAVQQHVDMAKHAETLYAESERRRAKAARAIRAALEFVAEPQRELAALQEAFAQRLGKGYSTPEELNELVRELERRGVKQPAAIFAKHSFSTIPSATKGWLRDWRLESAPVEFGQLFDVAGRS